ncbi:superoxide dismutase family protein [Rhodohalobacter barkolensis]|uniref:Superoxide dismutase [Cu-Zn] n=1 Tax=Rhodohalobacter barkolensis TaxID=2053187 RepID=A0A2N0VDY4_9BACT|nr:superoxide dismutase family protein [Rhodohalobacter barkolensis]PKD42399.1 superoxide dismutase family protein [Rhodohalobacter barkolensis]
MMKYISIALMALFLFASCAEQEQEEVEMEYQTQSEDKAVAVLHATEGNSAEGTVVFTQTDEGVRVEASISGLEANSMHGFHIHEFGDCRADDGTSAAGHFNPEEMEHGGPDDDVRHVGDLGNLESDEDGNANVDFVDPRLQLSGMTSIMGRGVIVHAGEDDLESQPTGDAGARLSCGVIGVANPDY